MSNERMYDKLKLYSLGEYHVQGETLGKGNFSEVMLARHRVVGCRVALKIYKTTKETENYVMKNLTREATILSKLSHPNIVKLYEAFMCNNLYCLSLEWIMGGDLGQHIKQRGGKLRENEARLLFLQLISAIDYIHAKGILHRDLKAENVLMMTADVLKLVDFGLSNFYFPDAVLKTRCGSPEYAAPELFQSYERYGPGIDIWSMGIILYIMLIGSLPFTYPRNVDANAGGRRKLLQIKLSKGLVAEHHRAMAHLSKDCRSLIFGMIQPNPEDRITLHHLKSHRWLRNCANKATTGMNEQRIDMMRIHFNVLKELEILTGIHYADIEAQIHDMKFNTYYAMYHLMRDSIMKSYHETTYVEPRFLLNSKCDQQTPSVQTWLEENTKAQCSPIPPPKAKFDGNATRAANYARRSSIPTASPALRKRENTKDEEKTNTTIVSVLDKRNVKCNAPRSSQDRNVALRSFRDKQNFESNHQKANNIPNINEKTRDVRNKEYCPSGGYCTEGTKTMTKCREDGADKNYSNTMNQLELSTMPKTHSISRSDNKTSKMSANDGCHSRQSQRPGTSNKTPHHCQRQASSTSCKQRFPPVIPSKPNENSSVIHIDDSPKTPVTILKRPSQNTPANESEVIILPRVTILQRPKPIDTKQNVVRSPLDGKPKHASNREFNDIKTSNKHQSDFSKQTAYTSNRNNERPPVNERSTNYRKETVPLRHENYNDKNNGKPYIVRRPITSMAKNNKPKIREELNSNSSGVTSSSMESNFKCKCNKVRPRQRKYPLEYHKNRTNDKLGNLWLGASERPNHNYYKAIRPPHNADQGNNDTKEFKNEKIVRQGINTTENSIEKYNIFPRREQRGKPEADIKLRNVQATPETNQQRKDQFRLPKIQYNAEQNRNRRSSPQGQRRFQERIVYPKTPTERYKGSAVKEPAFRKIISTVNNDHGDHQALKNPNALGYINNGFHVDEEITMGNPRWPQSPGIKESFQLPRFNNRR